MKLISYNNVLFVIFVVLIQLIQHVKASDCEVFENILNSIGNVLGDKKSNCCEYPEVKCDDQNNIKEM